MALLDIAPATATTKMPGRTGFWAILWHLLHKPGSPGQIIAAQERRAAARRAVDRLL